MILAAGFGTRLAPLTDTLPKALVPVAGRPMIDHAIEAVKRAGCTRIIINAHHHIAKMQEHFDKTDYGCEVLLSVEEEILGTGGALVHARELLEGKERFLLHNADVVSDFDLNALIEVHKQTGTLATLAINRRNSSRAVLFDKDMRFIGKEVWKEEGLAVPPGAQRYGFCGIHVVSIELFSYDLPAGFSDIFDLYRRSMKERAALSGRVYDGFWMDLGTREQIRKYEEFSSR